MKHLPRILIAAAASGSGKTMVTIGLLAHCKQVGKPVSAFKCGPDYIDPMFHQHILKVKSRNLDTFFSDREDLFSQLDTAEGMAIMEGVMGLYDGLGGLREEGSAYHLAETTKTPILLVINAAGMGRTIVSLLKGICMDDKAGLIKGVILNQTSQSFYETIAPVIKAETGLCPLGYLPKLRDFSLSSRHLGLQMPEEVQNLDEKVQLLRKTLGSSLQMDRIFEIAEAAEDYEGISKRTEGQEQENPGLRLAVAKDEAFCFYYQANLEMLAERGIQLVPFSPIHDPGLPEQIDGILLGGGYPELALEALAANESMRKALAAKLEAGIPCLAECGGFMYLHETISDDTGRKWPMVGSIQGSCHNTGRLCRFGYVKVEPKDTELVIRGHEFHYYDSSSNGSACRITKPVSGRNWEGMHMGENFLWGFPHLYYPSCPMLVEWFTNCMKDWHKKADHRL